MADVKPLDVDQVYHRCPEQDLPFETTAELEPLSEPVGQARLLNALRFATGIENHGFNLFVLGPRGIDSRAFVRRYLTEHAARRDVPSDWCYVYNFDDANNPRALELGDGDGRRLRDDMEGFIEELEGGIAAVFEGEEYQSRMQDIQEELEQQQREGLSAIGKEARESDIALVSTPSGFSLVPMRDDEVLEPEEFKKLPEEERKRIEERISELQKKLQQEIQRIPALRKSFQKRVRDLNEEMIQFALGAPVEALKQGWLEDKDVLAWVESAREHIVENAAFLRGQDGSGPPRALLDRFRVNVLVDNSKTSGAPVIYEDLPTHHRLVGRIEHQVRDGAVYADFSRILPGALHQANGGYLIVDAARVLSHPMAWESLKRALVSGDIRVESLDRLYGLASTASIEPDRIPLSVKVVLVGERQLYYLLAQHDPDFLELFKIEADFEDDIERHGDNLELYARLLCSLARASGCPPLHRSAVARMIEHSSRLADDQRRLSAGDRVLRDVLAEAGYRAREDRSESVTAEHVQQAIDGRNERAGRLRQASLDQIRRGIVMISTSGKEVAGINGLSVLQLGDFRFGQPTRITATARPGSGRVVDIEREVKLGGPIHSKGMLILSSYIASRYAATSNLSLAASVVFEQSYGGVDGDSASLAETCVLLSAIARVPLRQSLAVTGSISQHGQVQAVGGVSEKVEGFFEVCRQAGKLEGQGVIIPASNVEHLMVNPDVQKAVADDSFRIYPVRSVSEALGLLTGMPVGEADENGDYPEGSFNRCVADRLAEFARAARRDRRRKDDNESDGDDNSSSE